MYELGNQCLCTLSTAPTFKWNREEANSQTNFPTYSTLGALPLENKSNSKNPEMHTLVLQNLHMLAIIVYF